MAFASRSSFQLTALALAVASIGVHAAPINWATDTSGNWSLPINWSPLGLPDSSSDVSIVLTGVKTITHDVGNDTIHTLAFNAGTANPNATLLVTGGSSLTVNAGGTNGSVIRADNGNVSFNGGTLVNLGTLSAINSGTVAVSNGAVVQGGTLTTASGGAIVLSSNAMLDGATSGAITNAGSVNVTGGQTAFVAGSIVNNGAITVGANADLQNRTPSTTFSGTGTITLTDGNTRMFSSGGTNMLTFGSGQTVMGQGQIGLNQTIIVNAGVIAADTGTLSLDPVDGAGNFVNTGTLRAQNGGTLQLLTGTYTNAGATVTALAGSVVSVTNSSVVSGGTVSTVGTGVVNFLGSAVMDGATNGALTLSGNVNVVGGQTAYALGTINDNHLTVGANADLRAQGGNNLTLANNGTLTLTDGNSRLYGDANTNVITNTAGNTIQGTGQIGVNSAIIVNSGLITSNGGGNINLDPTDGTGGFLNTGTIRAENASSVQFLTGTYQNNGALITATGNSSINITNSAIIQGGTLTAAAGSAINFLNSAVLDGLTHGAISTNGNVNVVGGQTAYALGTINDNNLTVGANADLRAQGGNNLTLANNGTLTLTDGNSRLYGDANTNVITNTVGNTIQGTGQIGVNSAIIVNSGLITSNGGGNINLDPTDGTGGFLNTGTIRAENASSVQFLTGTYQNNGALITATGNSSINITNSAIIQGGTLTAAAGSAINFLNSAVLDGLTHGAISTNGNVNVVGGQTAYALGTINDNNLTVGANADLRAQGGNNLTLANNGTLTLTDGNSRIYGDTSTNVITNTAGNTIQGVGQIGINSATIVNNGLITANVSGQTIQIDPTDGDSVHGGLTNTGTIRAENGGNVNLLFAHYNNAGGTIAALNGSSVNAFNSAIIEGGTLSTTGSGSITLSGSAVLDGAAHGTLTNTGTVLVAGGQTAYFTGAIANNGAITVGGNADWRIQGTSNATISGTGTVTLADGNTRIFGDNGADLLTIGAGQTVQGVGQIGVNTLQLTNAGTIAANVGGQTLNVFPNTPLTNQSSGVLLASNGGTLNLISAVNGTGTIRSDSGGTVNLNVASTTGNLINNANLSLNANNVTVSSDYNNANFGTGNAFNKRSNVTGTGQILASGNVAQAITGTNVTNGTGSTPTLTIGNVRVGGTTYNYQVANTGTNGPAIRGALETGVNGGNITDSRLSGSGVTASNYGPVAAGANSGNLGVTFTVANAGVLAPLSGQAVHVANNFDNLGEQTLNIALASGAAAYNAAVGATTPTPIVFGNVRVNTADTQALTVRNTQTAGSFSEDLNAAFGTSTGSASGTGSVNGVVAGNASTGALNASLNTTTAGAKSGTVTVNYATAGTVNGVSNGLGTLGVGSQTIALSGNVYNAAVGSTTPSPVTIANQRVNGTNSQTLTVANTAAAGSFSEALNASFSGATGTATNNGGSITNIAAGGSNASALAVGVNTTSSGAKSGTVTIGYQTDGTGSNGNSGLAAMTAGSQNVTVSGNVYQAAAGSILTSALNFGTVQVGQTVNQALSIKNTATGAAGFVEDLNASFGATSGTGSSLIIGSGSLSGLAAGATGSGLTVGVNTSQAGTINGSIAVNFFSAGTVGGVSNGLGTLAVGSAGYGVAGTIQGTGTVVNQASPVINNNPIALGNVRMNSAAPSAFVSVTNQSTASPQAALDASISGNGAITGSGSFSLLNPGATNNSSLAVGFNTTTAGSKSGTATISFISDAANIGNCAPNCQMTIASQDVSVSGAVYRLASPTLATSSVTVAGRVGSVAPTTAVGITNSSSDIYTEGLSVTRGTTSSGFTSSGSITNLAASGSSNAIGVTLNTMTAGTFSGSQALNFVSTGAGTTGAADLSVGSASVTLNGKVYTPAVATNNTPAVAFGIVHVGDTLSQGVSVTNSAATTALNDVLVASAASATGPFTASGNLGTGLAAGATSANALKVGLNTTNAGVYSGAAAFSAASHDGDLSDAALANLAVSLSGTVNNYATDRFSLGTGAGTLTQSGSTFILDYGTVQQNSGTLATTLLAANSASGPADLLDGSFQFLDPADFGESGFAAFANLAAGQTDGPLSLSFSSLTLGSFSDTITLHGVGHNGSGYSASIGDIQLIVRGNVVSGQVTPPPPPNGVPEPDSLLLLGLGLPLLFLRRGRKSTAAVTG